VVCGEVGVRLRAEPGTTVGVDVAYISAATVAATPRNARLVEGAPVLVVEILSPTDEHEDVVEKIEEYLDCGVGLVWLADPAFCTVTVYRADARPALFNADQEMPEHPLLPGLRAKVAEFFG
jgi:Uma2 family endonuclease